MAGHSKWKNIQHRKGKQDKLRSKLFTQVSREIIMAAKAGGGDPSGNSRLRVALEKAKSSGVPQENINRAIQRGTGAIEGADYEEITYEGYGPGGSALMVECYSENRNRTVADLRHAFSKNGGNMSENGSVSWQFKHVGQIIVPSEGVDEDEVTMTALDGGAVDVAPDEDVIVVETAIEDLHRCNDALLAAGFKTEEVSLTWIATNMASPTEDDMRKLVKLIDTLEDLDDVKSTYVNVDIPEEIYAEA